MFPGLRDADGPTTTVAAFGTSSPNAMTIGHKGELITVHLLPALTPENAQHYPDRAPIALRVSRGGRALLPPPGWPRLGRQLPRDTRTRISAPCSRT